MLKGDEMHWLASLAIGLLGFGLLTVIYAGYEHHWPSSYRNLADTYGLRVTQRLWRLVTFRALPVFFVTTLVVALSNRAHGEAAIAVITAVTLHTAVTNVRALVNGLIPGRPEAIINYGSYHLLAVGISAMGAIFGYLAFPFTKQYVPSTTSLTESVWTAGLVAVLGAFLIRLTSKEEEGRSSDERYKYEKALRDAGIDLFDEIFSRAAHFRADPLLARSVAVAEILQRPLWLRRSERFLGLFRRAGSYGIMQMQADRPLSDAESIDLFCKEYRNLVALEVDESGTYGQSNHSMLWLAGGKHNGDKTFIDTITALYEWFAANTEWVQSEDAFGLIGVIEKRRYAVEVGFRIGTTAESIEFLLGDDIERLKRPLESGVGDWWWIEKRLPITSIGLWVREEGCEQFILVDPEKRGYFV